MAQIKTVVALWQGAYQESYKRKNCTLNRIILYSDYIQIAQLYIFGNSSNTAVKMYLNELILYLNIKKYCKLLFFCNVLIFTATELFKLSGYILKIIINQLWPISQSHVQFQLFVFTIQSCNTHYLSILYTYIYIIYPCLIHILSAIILFSFYHNFS